VTLSTVLHGAWGLLLGRTLGRERVVFGSTVSGRAENTAGIEEIVGPMINTVPVPMAWAAHEPLDTVLARLQDQQLAVLDHQHLGLVELARIAGVGELFDTIVVVENFAVTESAESADGLPTAEWIDGTDAAHYPVALVVHPDERLRLKISYDTGLVAAAFAGRLVEAMALFLEQFADDPAITGAGLRVGAAPRWSSRGGGGPPRRAPRPPPPKTQTTLHACGPPAMLEAVRALCAEREVHGQLAMESGMACGFGACFGCVVPTHRGYVRTCVDGPVVAADRLEAVPAA
jgi:non-ribosomal peptide synthetase component F